jgi:hypothetical protein
MLIAEHMLDRDASMGTDPYVIHAAPVALALRPYHRVKPVTARGEIHFLGLCAPIAGHRSGKLVRCHDGVRVEVFYDLSLAVGADFFLPLIV